MIKNIVNFLRYLAIPIIIVLLLFENCGILDSASFVKSQKQLKQIDLNPQKGNLPALRATYLYSLGWFRALKLSGALSSDTTAKIFYKNVDAFTAAVDYTVQDIYDIGFNAIILTPWSYPGLQVGDMEWDTYVEIFAKAAATRKLKIFVGMSPNFVDQVPPTGDDFAAWINSCELNTDTATQVRKFSQLEAVAGFVCAFESWQNDDALPLVDVPKIKKLKEYIESFGRYYLNVPATDTPVPDETAFSGYTPQIAPNRLMTDGILQQDKFDELFARNNQADRGIELNLAHSDLYNDDKTAKLNLFKQWHLYQYNSLVKYQPPLITNFAYHMLAWHTDGLVEFYQPRGLWMSALGKILDSRLLFYDPLESRYASALLGADFSGATYYRSGVYGAIPGVGKGAVTLNRGGCLKYPGTDPYSGQRYLNPAEGTVSLWIKPLWPSDDRNRVVFFSTVCYGGADCFRLEKSPAGELMFYIVDTPTRTAGTSVNIAHWEKNDWHFVAVAWNERQASLEIYVDGEQASVRQSNWALEDSVQNSALYLGVPGLVSEETAIVELDDFRIYNTNLTAAEIKKLNEGKATNGASSSAPFRNH